MRGWIPFFLMLFIEIAGATPILPRGVTVTRTASFYLSIRPITRTKNGALKTTTFIEQTAVLTTETLDDHGRTITPSGAPASKNLADPALNLAPTPTPTPASASTNDPATITMIVTLNTSTTHSTLHASISPSRAALRTSSSIALDAIQDVGLVSTASSLSSQSTVQATSKDEEEGAGQSKPKKINAVVIIGGIMIGLSFTTILFFALYWKWRRKQKAKLDLLSPAEWDYEPAFDSAKELVMRTSPFPQSALQSILNHKGSLTATPATSRAPTVILPPLPAGMPESRFYPPGLARSTMDLPISPFLTPPTPVQSIARAHLGRSHSRKDLMISRDMITHRPPTPPPGYSA